MSPARTICIRKKVSCSLARGALRASVRVSLRGVSLYFGLTQDLRPGLLSAAPPGLGFGLNAPKLVQNLVFGEILSSPLAGLNLRKWLLARRIYF
jgi:hypothetical protein